MISIILPFKNEQLYLRQVLSSILEQTEKNFEVLAVNDHSTDESYAIVQSISKQDSRIKPLMSNGKGVIEALKTGFAHAQGKFVTRQDGDDLMPINKLQILKEQLLAAGPGNISTGKVSYFSDQELGEGFKKYEKWLNSLCEERNHWQQIYKECVVASSNWLMFAEDFKKLDYFADIIYPEDYFLVFKLFQHNFNVICSDQVTHLWRDHSKRASRTSELYKNQNFFPLKVRFFLELNDRDNIVIWGAGSNGKELVREFQAHHIHLQWLTSNSKKIGKSIYGIDIQDPQNFNFSPEQKLIICIREPNASRDIRNYLNRDQSPQIFEF